MGYFLDVEVYFCLAIAAPGFSNALTLPLAHGHIGNKTQEANQEGNDENFNNGVSDLMQGMSW
ncbi:MAG: hypothetical protein JNJ51_04335 [Methylobacillus glycogenes]|nr:hypothetical protein [Methylobacillus glycogenes]